MRPRIPMIILAGMFVAGLSLLTACSLSGSSSGTSVSTVTTISTPTPTTPSGAYAFVRDGDIWARTGIGPAHQVTYLHLNPTEATWGQLAWSPDHSMLAFVLRAQTIAPGSADGAPGQGSGTVFIVNVNVGTILVLNGSSSHLTASLTGRHLAWMPTNTLLVSTNGVIKTVTLGQSTPTIGVLSGPSDVWEIAMRGSTLWYSTISNLTSSGVGVAQLHQLNLQGSGTDTSVATLGPVTLPAELCGGFVCPPDTTTPYIPYAWDVNLDNSKIVYQTAASATTATPTPTAKPGATTTATPKATATPKPSPSPTPTGQTMRFVTANADGSDAQPIFTTVPPTSSPVTLGYAPDGAHIALAPATSGQTKYGPFVESTAPNSGVVTLPLPAGASALDSAGGIVTWSPDSQGFTLSVTMAGTAPSTPYIVTFLPKGQSATIETNASDPAWAD